MSFACLGARGLARRSAGRRAVIGHVAGVQLAHDGVAAVLLGGPRQRLAEVVVPVLAGEAVQVGLVALEAEQVPANRVRQQRQGAHLVHDLLVVTGSERSLVGEEEALQQAWNRRREVRRSLVVSDHRPRPGGADRCSCMSATRALLRAERRDRMKNLRIGVRLALSYTLLAAFLIFTGIFGLTEMSAMNESVSEIAGPRWEKD